jgi:hypothetical protein
MTTVPNRYVECRLVPFAVGENIKMSAQRVLLELVGDQIAQALKTLAQVRGPGGQINAGGWTQRYHPA